ncbi:hypothetical protein E1281_36845 [Actinomadura sp. KC345]|uniref:hypothetical protein n=1 Tax=Actinomadura sp. KC345 TaxID=2530371 RepID=UPI00104FC924|nr:hypothetical protein [Actinomadura sp. KC345]TDC41915.1 hypothetical protein E1281_36845 [Actinomadura sp. KC345]
MPELGGQRHHAGWCRAARYGYRHTDQCDVRRLPRHNGVRHTITADNLPWSFNAIGYNAATQVATGTLTGFAVTVSHFGCTYTIGAPGGGSGTISATYTNANPDIGISTIDLSGTNLEIQATSGAGCGALYEPGHDIAFHGQYGVAPPGQTITSP